MLETGVAFTVLGTEPPQYTPGLDCLVVVDGRPYWSRVSKAPCRVNGGWSVEVLLPWGERRSFAPMEVAI